MSQVATTSSRITRMPSNTAPNPVVQGLGRDRRHDPLLPRSRAGKQQVSISSPAVRRRDDNADKEEAMQYVMLIYQGTTPLPGTDAWNELPEEQQKRIYADYGTLNETPGVTPGLPLGLPENATTVRVEDGKTLTTDGPFVSVKEAIGGFFVLEADDLDAAIELASKLPAARLGGAIEIRPSEQYW
jgi:hypothetical protein